MKHMSLLLTGALFGTLLLAGCNSGSETTTKEGSTTGGEAPAVSGGEIKIDGSSTVYPIAAALVESYKMKVGDKAPSMSVSQAGTGAGFKKFAGGDLDIATASKPISEDQMKACADGGVEFVELPIAYDGLSIVVHKDNTWVKSITTEQLKKIWDKDSTVKMWSDVDPSWPKEPIQLFGPTSDHGSYEYFNEVINGDKKNSRQDYQQNNDYNTMIAGVANNKNAFAYVGYAYVMQNQGQIKVVPVDAGSGAVAPSEATIVDGTYAPLSRPLMLYANKKSLERPEVKGFLEFALKEGSEAVAATNYVALPSELYAKVLARLEAGKTGTVFAGSVGTKLSDLLAKE